jgi:hypothetical protein
MVDNSQGHSAYAEDALVALRMNTKPGGNRPGFVIDGMSMTVSALFNQ